MRLSTEGVKRCRGAQFKNQIMTEEQCAEQNLPFIPELMVCDNSTASREAINAHRIQQQNKNKNKKPNRKP
ncbi:hypothetical protein E2C01_097975 [Portunus trituberculatus]|uniref:Uncharacterized protein n=1 Tax=Portunus trituberculatus TaxID=210409 RepID=A0A5B7K765_PORTR|nr:hypothetical protein [Portunus trituberculatus]